MHRKPFTLLSLLALVLLSAVGTPALGEVTCAAGNPNANASETTPTADFTVNGDGTVTHAKTGLMWKQCAEGRSGADCTTGAASSMPWASALNAANTANAANGGLGFANHTDWRLPNQKELQSIVESCGYNPSINQAMFPATPVSYFWSASSYVPSPARAWFVFFYNGNSGANFKPISHYVRLVRGGQSLDSFDGLSPTYGVTYDGNGSTGGSVPVDGGAYPPGASVTVLGNTGSLVKIGYSFAGWNTAANGSGAPYAAGASLTMGPGNVTLYAQWTLTATTSQTINFGGVPNKTLAQSPVTVSAHASSGLPVTFSTTTPAVCTAGGTNGSVINLLAVGTCTVQADQAGDAVYDPAPSKAQSFRVSMAKQTIDFGKLADKTLAQSPVTVSATGGGSGNPVTFTTTTPVVCMASGPNGSVINLLAAGTCNVQADQAGNAVYSPALSKAQSFRVKP